MANSVLLREELPGVEEFIQLRESAGWGIVTQGTAQKSIQNALFTVCLRKGEDLVGLGRVVGDGVLYFYISDVIVSPKVHGGGHGKTIMEAITRYLDSAAQKGSSIALLSAPGKEPFYEKFGFSRCPNAVFGGGMSYLKLMRVDE